MELSLANGLTRLTCVERQHSKIRRVKLNVQTLTVWSPIANITDKVGIWWCSTGFHPCSVLRHVKLKKTGGLIDVAGSKAKGRRQLRC